MMDDELSARLARIEAKLDALLAALADDEEDVKFDLDGNPVAPDRDEGAEL